YKTVGLGTTTWSPLASGILSGKYNDQFPNGTRLGMEGLEWLKERNLTQERITAVLGLTELAKELGLSLPVMSLAWCLKNPNVSTVILGASKLVQLQENMKALGAQELLTPAVMNRIEDILNNKPIFPAY
ncbi:MAG: aldo/keto reductase, partial [Sphingomonadales bacterium]